MVGQENKAETQNIMTGRLLHTFDRIWTVGGVLGERFVCFQDEEIFTVLRHFRDHNEYEDFLNLLEKRWYGLKKLAKKGGRREIPK